MYSTYNRKQLKQTKLMLTSDRFYFVILGTATVTCGLMLQSDIYPCVDFLKRTKTELEKSVLTRSSCFTKVSYYSTIRTLKKYFFYNI